MRRIQKPCQGLSRSMHQGRREAQEIHARVESAQLETPSLLERGRSAGLFFRTECSQAAQLDESVHKDALGTDKHMQAAAALAQPLDRVDNIGGTPGLVVARKVIAAGIAQQVLRA